MISKEQFHAGLLQVDNGTSIEKKGLDVNNIRNNISLQIRQSMKRSRRASSNDTVINVVKEGKLFSTICRQFQSLFNKSVQENP